MQTENFRLADIWAAEQSILDAIDQVCTENHLRYSLGYGTLLGAVRHQGFIPWDDDIDLVMPREDYEKLLSIWDYCAPEGYLLDRCEVQKDAVNNFSKIRKDHTTFIQSADDLMRCHHQGVFVDIFPGDRAAVGFFSSKIQLVDFALNLLFCRGHTSGSGGAIGLAERALLNIVPKKHYLKTSLYFGRRSRRWNRCANLPYVFPSTIRDSRLHYPAELFDNLQRILFQGKLYSAVRDTNSTLTIEYGSYMELPPEEERVWKHHPILVDLTRNYDELPQSIQALASGKERG